jgi:AcrR family transcriptional regulator
VYTLYTGVGQGFCGRSEVVDEKNRTSLSQEKILRAALEIVDRQSVDELTIRSLSKQLEVTPMAVYRHFKNKQEIISGLWEVVVQDSAPSVHCTKPWQQWLIQTFGNIRQALLQHPGVMPLLGPYAGAGPHAQRVINDILEQLHSLGLDPAQCVSHFHSLISYTLGSVTIENLTHQQLAASEIQNPKEWLRQLQLRFASADYTKFPRLVKMAPNLASFLSNQQFEIGLERLVHAIELAVKNC